MKPLVSLSFALSMSLSLFGATRALADVPHAPPPDAAEPAAAAPTTDKEGFVPVKEGEALGPGEVLPATGLVAGAYGFILAAMVIWVATVAARTRRVEEDVTALRAKIDRAG